MIVLRMPWHSPPLRSNDRLHWRAKAKESRLIRDASMMITRSAMAIKTAPRAERIAGPVTVTLVWEVTDYRRRDVGASGPTLKAWIDGMVDAGLLPDDSARVVVEERLRIEVGKRRGVRVEIRETTS